MKEKRYRCDGCDDMIPADDVVEYHGSLAHEYAGDDGEPEVCGTVREIKKTQDDSKD
jgi:hypothetical protein